MTGSETADVLVLGSGGLGSAIVHHLAKAGADVLGIDRHHPPHRHGSSHGNTRLIRKAYFEDPRYIPLLERSYELWRNLEQASGKNLYRETGLLILRDSETGLTARALENAKANHVDLERLDANQLKARFPQFEVTSDVHGLFEKQAGYLNVEASVQAHLEQGKRAGARFAFNETVHSWRARPGEITVRTDKKTYHAKQLVLAPGAWTAGLLKDFGMSFTVRRGVQFWFGGLPKHESMPCFGFAVGGTFIYGFPQIPGVGLKAADYAPSDVLKVPEDQLTGYRPDELLPVTSRLQRFFPDVNPTPIASSPCLYSLTRDENFLIDRHPEHSQVFLAVGDSGHAFKFAPVIGEIVAGMVLRAPPKFDLGFLAYRS